MSFGKDPRDADAVIPFGGGTMSQRDKFRKQQAAKERASRGSSTPYWSDTFQLPTDHPRLGRFIKGAYVQRDTFGDITLEYVCYREHYHGSLKRGCICSAGPFFADKKRAEPCLGCQVFWEDFRIRRQKKANNDTSRGPDRISSRPAFAFNWLDYGLWLKLPRVDKRGSLSINKQTQQPFFDWKPVPPNDPRQSMHEGKWGNLLPWSMSESFKTSLFQYMDNTICNDCATCGGMGTIMCVNKVCGNPACRHQVYDPQNSTLTMQQRAELDSDLYGCPVCEQKTLIEEVVACRACSTQNLQARRANIFDVDLELMSVKSGDGMQTNLQILNRSNPRPVHNGANIKPLDLLARYQPTPIEQQSAVWGLPLNASTDTGIPAVADQTAPAPAYPMTYMPQQNPPTQPPTQGAYPFVQTQQQAPTYPTYQPGPAPMKYPGQP